MKCEERSLEKPLAKDAVWVPNGDQLYYPYVSSCVTVTLVFENGALGGHASQVAAEKGGDFRQAENLQDVIARMKDEDPGKAERGALKRVYFIGLTETEQWNFDQALKDIAENFGPLKEGKPFKYDRSPVEIVFDGGSLYTLESKTELPKGEAQKVALIKHRGRRESYSA
jgi:hypothetical protein